MRTIRNRRFSRESSCSRRISCSEPRDAEARRSRVRLALLMTAKLFTAHPLVVRRLRVLRTRFVTPRMVRVTLDGPKLGAFERNGWNMPEFAYGAFDDHVKLLFASDGDVEAVLPRQAEHGIEWTASETRLARDCTPRRLDRAAGELDLDFVVHGGEHATGPAEDWARGARPGDAVHLVGPKSSASNPDGIRRVVLVGDETALPAIGRFFDERPIDAPAHAIITIADESARQDLAARAGDEVQWVIAAPGDPAPIVAAVEALGELPEQTYFWAAAESRALLPVRRHVTRTLGIPKSHVDVTGYWHLVEHDETDASGEAATDDTDAHEHLEPPIPWFAVRAALRLAAARAPRELANEDRARAVDERERDEQTDVREGEVAEQKLCHER